MFRSIPFVSRLLIVNVVYLHAVAAAAPGDSPNYEDDIKPLFRTHCLKCHNADDAEADLDLSSFNSVMKGGSSGAVVKAGRPESSQLYLAIAHLDGAEAMPPESPRMPEEKLAIVREWIRGGLIAGKGGKSQLRNVAAMLAPVSPGTPAPLPESLPDVPIAETARPPIPQALAIGQASFISGVTNYREIDLLVGLGWSPIRGFTIGTEFDWMHGTVSRPTGLANDAALIAAGLPAFKASENLFRGRLRMIRAF